MSNVRYFASDARLGGKENPFIKYYSIKEALEAGIDLDMDLLEGIDQNEPGVILWCDNEEHFDFPAIWISEPYDEAPQSVKKHFAEIGGNPLMDLPGMLGYICQHMADNPLVSELELWDVWLGNDKQELVEKACSLKDLTADVLAEVFDQEKEVDYKLTIVR